MDAAAADDADDDDDDDKDIDLSSFDTFCVPSTLLPTSFFELFFVL